MILASIVAPLLTDVSYVTGWMLLGVGAGISVGISCIGAAAMSDTVLDLREAIDVLTARLADFGLRITGAVAQVAEHMESHGKLLNKILDRLPPRP
jgi:hypothetical protein